MAGRLYEEPGAPASDADEALKAKRRAMMDKRRRQSRDEYVSYPAPLDAGTVTAAALKVCESAKDAADAELLLGALGLLDSLRKGDGHERSIA